MLWVEAFHIILMVTWFAGLFYLPRLFVYHAEVNDQISRNRFVLMESRLFTIMSIGAAGTVLFGLWLLTEAPAYLRAGWLHAKLTLVAGLLGYHAWLWFLRRELQSGSGRSHRFYRWINEVPALFLIAIVILAVVKPF